MTDDAKICTCGAELMRHTYYDVPRYSCHKCGKEWLSAPTRMEATDDAMRKKRIQWTEFGWKCCLSSIREKLKSEEVVQKCRDEAREQAAKGVPYSSIIHAENLKWTMIARAVIDACILSIQDMESEQ